MDQGQSPRLVDHLIDIITITICAVICNADTIRRVFMRLKPQQVQSSFLSWVRALRRTQGGAGLMEIEGCIVTIDAIGTQKKIAQRIREGKADYVRALKADQSALHENVKLHLDDALARNFHDVPYDSHTTVEKDHGRFEKQGRHYISSFPADAKGFAKAARAYWGVENSPENFAVLHHSAPNLIKQEKGSKRSIKHKRLKAGWDDSYLERMLFGEE